LTTEQIAAAALLAATLGLFAWGRIRFDMAALLALLAAVALGLTPAEQAFLGFAHPAVITVAAVLVVSRAVAASGAVDKLAAFAAPTTGPFWLQIGGLCLLGAGLSAFMNNVGALALLMPVAIAAALKAGRSPALLLMPLAFASMLGGLITLIGTPPNLIVATYRAQTGSQPFGMFDFAPVGLGVALVGVAFVALVGWRLIPLRRGARKTELFGIEDYIVEARLKPDAKAVGADFRQVEALLGDLDARLVNVIRGDRTIPSSAWWERIAPDDVLVLEAAPDAIQDALDQLGAELTGEERTAEHLRSDEIEVVEAVLSPYGPLVGLTAEEVRLRSRYGINLLAVARQGRPHRGRLKSLRFEAGDALLLQGPPAQLAEALIALGAVPLAERGLRVGRPRKAGLTLGVAAIALAATAFGLAPVSIALAAAALAVVLTGALRVDEAYEAVDWPVIVLLGAMIPVGRTLETTGLTQLVAETALQHAAGFDPVWLLAGLLVVTMTLSDIVNNAATAVMMAPLAASLAAGLGVSPDPFLMAVAVGASCAFLTPIGHQNNTLVMGPGGYRFWDYWRMGLPLEAVVVAAAVPLILLVWPL
jgi:di/tricarboxylate transporter